MKTNQQLQKDVQDAINSVSISAEAAIQVEAENGVITLTGVVDSYAKKLSAECAAKNITGVKAIVDEVRIVHLSTTNFSDSLIAEKALAALKSKWIPDYQVKVSVNHGWVTLEGDLQWNFQKEAAENCCASLFGVMGITNTIVIKPVTPDEVERKKVQEALARNWSIDDQKIQISVLANNVTLTGTVNSTLQKEEAGRIAGNAPGVHTVTNDLTIEY